MDGPLPRRLKRRVSDLAARRIRFWGAGHQACRQALDQGRIGKIVGGAAAVLNHGMEHWHPNPTFFFKPGGGPVLDIGPYYINQLVHMIGPITHVTSIASSGSATRTITSDGPMTGRSIKVEVPTTVNAALAFENGANVTLSASWDVWQSERLPFEIYGSEGTMLVPDPNFFGSEPKGLRRRGRLAITRHQRLCLW